MVPFNKMVNEFCYQHAAEIVLDQYHQAPKHFSSAQTSKQEKQKNKARKKIKPKHAD